MKQKLALYCAFLVISFFVYRPLFAFETSALIGINTFDRDGATLISGRQLTSSGLGLNFELPGSRWLGLRLTYQNLRYKKEWELNELHLGATYSVNTQSMDAIFFASGIAYSGGSHQSRGMLLGAEYQYDGRLSSHGLLFGCASRLALWRKINLIMQLTLGLRTLESLGGTYTLPDRDIKAGSHQPVFMLSRALEIGVSHIL